MNNCSLMCRCLSRRAEGISLPDPFYGVFDLGAEMGDDGARLSQQFVHHPMKQRIRSHHAQAGPRHCRRPIHTPCMRRSAQGADDAAGCMCVLAVFRHMYLQPSQPTSSRVRTLSSTAPSTRISFSSWRTAASPPALAPPPHPRWCCLLSAASSLPPWARHTHHQRIRPRCAKYK